MIVKAFRTMTSISYIGWLQKVSISRRNLREKGTFFKTPDMRKRKHDITGNRKDTPLLVMVAVTSNVMPYEMLRDFFFNI